MANYYRRLLKLGIFLLVIVLVSVLLIAPFFSTNSTNLLSMAAPKNESMTGTTRVFNTVICNNDQNKSLSESLPQNFEKALENDKVVLYFCSKTGEIALQNKLSSQIWYSNPTTRDNENMVSGDIKKRLGSQLTITYYDSKGKEGQMDSVNDCLAYNGMSFNNKNNKLTVLYKFGKQRTTVNDVPRQMSAKRFENYVSEMSEKDQKNIKNYYAIATVKGKSETSIKALQVKYPNVKKNDIYYLKVTNERLLLKIQEMFASVGYTEEDLEQDNTENNIEAELSNRAHFSVPIQYSLDDDALMASIDFSKLGYDKNIPPKSISLLEYFGAGGKEDQGYMLVPDGSGSLIYFNNGKTSSSSFNIPIYGDNYLKSPINRYQVNEGAHIPIFGIQRGKESLFAEITSGMSLGSINARVSGMQNSYNAVYSEVTPICVEKVNVSESLNTATMIMYEKNPYKGTYSVRYTPLSQENSGYVKMADYYRNRLLKNGTLKQTKSESYPLLATVIGAIPVNKVTFGITVTGTESLTSFKQAENILLDLKSNGIDSIAMKYVGWFNGGIKQSYAGRINIENSLGGKKIFYKMIDNLKRNGIAVYPEVSFQNVYENGKGFSSKSNNIRGLDRDIIVSYFYDFISREKRYDTTPIYKLKSSLLVDEVNRFKKKYSSSNISTNDLGTEIYSDFNNRSTINREESMANCVEALKVLSGNSSLLLSCANNYSWKYASMLADVPCESSWMEISDVAVPFYQIVVRGYLPYVSKPLNTGMSEYHTLYLEAIEFGSGLNYQIMQNSPAVVKQTPYNYLCTGAIQEWHDIMIRDYKRAAEALKPVVGMKIIDHKCIDSLLFSTTYENGTIIYVNYGNDEKTIDSIKIPAKDFKVVIANE